MGLFSWLFPTPEQRLARARERFAAGHAAEARLDAIELGDLPGAAELLEQTEESLFEANLDAAVSWARAGDPERVEHHFELARQFQRQQPDPRYNDARAEIRRLREAQAAEKMAQQQDAARALLEVDARFHDSHNAIAIPLPEGVSEAEADAMRARVAILVDGYPEGLRADVPELGGMFIQAVFDREEGRAEEALQILLALPEDSPIVMHELALTASTLGDLRAAARAWRKFALAAGGHYAIGNHHTAALLAHALANTGDPHAALEVLEGARQDEPGLAGVLYASVLEAVGRLGDAEEVLRELAGKHGNQPIIAVMLARVRAKGGQRIAAMRTLETSLQQTVCEPGRCGYRPPDLATHRLLATLYLEDALEVDRGLELAEIARSMVKQPAWEDLYLAALVARQTGDPAWNDMVTKLQEITHADDPRRGLLEQHLAA